MPIFMTQTFLISLPNELLQDTSYLTVGFTYVFYVYALHLCIKSTCTTLINYMNVNNYKASRMYERYNGTSFMTQTVVIDLPKTSLNKINFSFKCSIFRP